MTSIAAAPRRRVLADLVVRPSGRARAFAVDASLVLAGVVVVSLLAQAAIPMWPVPITGQTLGVIVVGAALGARRGAAALTTYMLVGLAGLPVFAGGVGGPAYVLAPSFGFILGFIPAAFVAGWFAERAWDRRPFLAFTGFVAASIIPFLIGVPYMAVVLSVMNGAALPLVQVFEMGVFPFIVGGIVKAVIAALVLPLAWRAARTADARRDG